MGIVDRLTRRRHHPIRVRGSVVVLISIVAMVNAFVKKDTNPLALIVFARVSKGQLVARQPIMIQQIVWHIVIRIVVREKSAWKTYVNLVRKIMCRMQIKRHACAE